MYQGYCDIITVSTDDDDEESEVAGGEKENQPENRKSKRRRRERKSARKSKVENQPETDLEAGPNERYCNRDLKRTAIVHHILGCNKPLKLDILYNKMGKRYKENTNFSCFKEELKRCNIFKFHEKGFLTLNMCLKLEYLVATRINVKILKEKNVNRRIPISPKPSTEICKDKKTVKIRHLKANISGNNVYLRFTEKVALKIGTKDLNLNLQEGMNQKITLTLGLRQIYKTGDCLVEMDERKTLEATTQDKFEWDEELVEHFANNPFLSSPIAEIVNLCDSDDEE